MSAYQYFSNINACTEEWGRGFSNKTFSLKSVLLEQVRKIIEMYVQDTSNNANISQNECLKYLDPKCYEI